MSAKATRSSIGGLQLDAPSLGGAWPSTADWLLGLPLAWLAWVLEPCPFYLVCAVKHATVYNSAYCVYTDLRDLRRDFARGLQSGTLYSSYAAILYKSPSSKLASNCAIVLANASFGRLGRTRQRAPEAFYSVCANRNTCYSGSQVVAHGRSGSLGANR
jgi:hypothetical protein